MELIAGEAGCNAKLVTFSSSWPRNIEGLFYVMKIWDGVEVEAGYTLSHLFNGTNSWNI